MKPAQNAARPLAAAHLTAPELALPEQVALSVEMPMPSLPVAARIELAYRATRRLVDRVESTGRATNPKGTP